jgi:hypothetical protein
MGEQEIEPALAHEPGSAGKRPRPVPAFSQRALLARDLIDQKAQRSERPLGGFGRRAQRSIC